MQNSAFWSQWVYLSAGRAGTGNNISLTSRLNGSIFTSQSRLEKPHKRANSSNAKSARFPAKA